MKNTITVIDQELIDDAKGTIKLDDDSCDRARVSVGTLKDLILMCEDLIEINAEITKREQKYKNKLGLCANHLLLLLGVDEIEGEDDKSTINAKANEFLIELDSILNYV